MKLPTTIRFVLLIGFSALLLILASCESNAPMVSGTREQSPRQHSEPTFGSSSQQSQIDANLLTVRELQMQMRYDEALQVVDQILLLDPMNPPALALRDAIQTTQMWMDVQRIDRDKENGFAWSIMRNREAAVAPYPDLAGAGPRSTTGLVQYPEDWPSLSTRRTDGPTIKKSTVPIGGADEVWVIAKPAPRTSPDNTREPIDHAELDRQVKHYATQILNRPDLLLTEMPCGGLIGVDVAREEPLIIPMPLEHTAVNASIASTIASVQVTQQYRNPYNGKVEAVYVFPLPDDAAVYDFLMTIGGRTIRGIIREREEAEQIYEEARAQGYRASLLTQERPNIFTQKVANLEPGASIDIDIKYFHTITQVDGWYEFIFPMVVGPRFNPPGSNDPITATARSAPASTNQSGTDVRYLSPNERSGHDISVNVAIEAGMAIESLASSTHVIRTEWDGSDRARVALAPSDTIPNKDFVLRYRLAGTETKAGMIVHRAGDDGYFNLTIMPPAALESIQRRPIEMVFVLDTSGSMSGLPLKQAREAAEYALKQLRPEDSFQIIRFSESASALGSRPLSATRENIQRGVQHLQTLSSGGGTMMIEGIKASLDFPMDENRQRYVVFLTDGYIGNETEILREMQHRLNGARVFSFGIGSSVNRYLMERMAALGEGAVAYIGAHDDPISIMQAFIDRAAHPAMEHLKIDWGGLAVRDVYPNELPDLFVGRPISISGRFDPGSLPRTGQAMIRVRGFAGEHELTVPVAVSAEMLDEQAHPAIEKIWARRSLMELMNRATIDATLARQLPERVKSVALAHGLMSAYTAFIAVDSSSRTEGAYGTTVPIAVPVPDGVRYETTVSPGSRGHAGRDD